MFQAARENIARYSGSTLSLSDAWHHRSGKNSTSSSSSKSLSWASESVNRYKYVCMYVVQACSACSASYVSVSM